MKKLVGIGICLLSILYGCGKGTEGGGGSVGAPNPPTKLTITAAGADSLSLKLSWKASTTSGADEYFVYFNSSRIADISDTSYTYVPFSLGDYKVAAYKGGKTSDFSNVVSTKLVQKNTQGPIHILNDPRGYGWDSLGTGTVYSIGTPGNRQNKDKIDFVIDSSINIRDPNNFDSQFQHITQIAYNPLWLNEYDSISTVPSQTNFGPQQPLVTGGVYIFLVHNKYYVKLSVSGNTISDSVFVTYGFQKISGFRRLK